MATNTAVADKELGRWARRRENKAKYKRDYTEQMTVLLECTRLGYTWYAKLIKFAYLFPLCWLVSSLFVKGGYDWLVETGISVLWLGVLYIALGFLLPWWGIRRAARREEHKTSVGTWIFIGLALTMLGIFCLISARTFDIHTNTQLWHRWNNKEMRDAFGRNGWQGLFAGLFYVFASWDPVKAELKGSWADPILQKLRWPNSLEDEDVRPLRAWHVLSLPFIMVALAAGFFWGFWELHQLTVSHADAIHAWFHRTVPWHVHSSLPAIFEARANHIANIVADQWWIQFAGFLASLTLVRIPAKPVINLLQEDNQQTRIRQKLSPTRRSIIGWRRQRKHNSTLRTVMSSFRSLGANARSAWEYWEALYITYVVQASPDPDSVAEFEPTAAMIGEVKEALEGVSQTRVNQVVVTFVENEKKTRDPGVMIPIRLLAWCTPLFMAFALWYVYIKPHLHTSHTTAAMMIVQLLLR